MATGPALSPLDRAPGSDTYFVLIEDIENKSGKFGWVTEGEELLIDLLEAGGIELPAGTVLDKALVPANGGQSMGPGGSSAEPWAAGMMLSPVLQWAGAGKVPRRSLCHSHLPPAASQPCGQGPCGHHGEGGSGDKQ